MAGTLVTDTLTDGSGNSTSTTTVVRGSAKAWVNFNGTTSPGTIRAQYNVSSVTRNGTGDYTVNFTTAISDANYAAVFGCQNTAEDSANEAIAIRSDVNPTTTALRIMATRPAWAYADPAIVNVAIFR